VISDPSLGLGSTSTCTLTIILNVAVAGCFVPRLPVTTRLWYIHVPEIPRSSRHNCFVTSCGNFDASSIPGMIHYTNGIYMYQVAGLYKCTRYMYLVFVSIVLDTLVSSDLTMMGTSSWWHISFAVESFTHSHQIRGTRATSHSDHSPFSSTGTCTVLVFISHCQGRRRQPQNPCQRTKATKKKPAMEFRRIPYHSQLVFCGYYQC
jgi:hypothetical protein